MVADPLKAVRVFFCYAHEDGILLEKLKKHLIALQRQNLISIWYDRNISIGIEWAQEIDTQLNTSDIILLLISPNFMASEYCYSIEVEQAMKRHQQGEARVIPVILRSVYFKGAPFGKLQALPKNAKPITGPGWRSQDEAFFDVAEGIRQAAEELSLLKAGTRQNSSTNSPR
jgi:TIR domain